MTPKLFDPGPKTYTHLLERLNRQIDAKHKDHSTALDFTLKATIPSSEEGIQDALFVSAPVVEVPQEETLFSAEDLS